jgi:signal transduction histidine kinase
MERIRNIEEALVRSRRVAALVIVLALAVLAGVVTITTLQVRQRVREQIAGRDGEVLYAVALLYYAEDLAEGLADPIADPGNQLSIVLKSAQMRGVLGVRLFDAHGRFVESFPATVIEGELAGGDLPKLRALRPLSRFHARASMSQLFYPDESATGEEIIPLLEVNVPLHSGNGPLAGVAQFLVEGHSIAAEYALLDRHLALQAAAAFGAGAAILTAAFSWALRRLRRAHCLAAERTANLVRANQELALAAKTSALGAVTAHLIHGLKNPLAGLQNFVSARGTAPVSSEAADWEQAVASTQRMQAMIHQIIGVLREEHAAAGAYEVSLTELENIVRGRVQPLAREREVNFATAVQTKAGLPNRVANLVALILINLAENAVQATPAGRTARLTMDRDGTRITFEVRDEGAGFPADTPLFMPCRSAREGGTGIGLALCKQLANHLGAELELARSTAEGCVFVLSLPVGINQTKPATATVRG